MAWLTEVAPLPKQYAPVDLSGRGPHPTSETKRAGRLLLHSLLIPDAVVLIAPFFRQLDGAVKTWRKEFAFTLDKKHAIRGWAAIRAKASVAEAGLAVFRRNRLIVGSLDGAYRPEAIFRKSNSYTYQRLFGELYVDGFQVSHTKDELQWDEWEEQILEELRKKLDEDPLPLLQQAEGYRARASSKELPANWGADAVNEVAETIARHVAPVVSGQLVATPETRAPTAKLPPAEVTVSRSIGFEVEHARRTWRVEFQLARDPGSPDWYTPSIQLPRSATNAVTVAIRINLAHPFSERYALHGQEELQPLLRIAAGLAIAEYTAIESGAKGAPTLRRNFNELLKYALSNV